MLSSFVNLLVSTSFILTMRPCNVLMVNPGSSIGEMDDYTALQYIKEMVSSLPECNDGVRSTPETLHSYGYSSFFATSDGDISLVDGVKRMEIATFLSAQDNVSSIALLQIQYEANGANNESAEWVSSGFTIYQDCARHFLWNFRSIKNVFVNATQTRIYTINYEWSNVLKGEHDAKYQTKYDFYLAAGYSVSTADQLADADADDYVYYLRDYYHDVYITSETRFRIIFNSNNIMDFWNNLMGRNAAQEYSGWTNNVKRNAFASYMNSGNLIYDESFLTSYHWSAIYSNDNLWYPNA